MNNQFNKRRTISMAVVFSLLFCLAVSVMAQQRQESLPKIGQPIHIPKNIPVLSPSETKWINSLPPLPSVLQQYLSIKITEMSFQWVNEDLDNPISVSEQRLDFNKDGKKDFIVEIETGGTGGALMIVFVSKGNTYSIEYYRQNKGWKLLNNGFDTQVHGGECNLGGLDWCFRTYTWNGKHFVEGNTRRSPVSSK
jgi:hypothetical protein